MSIVKEVVAKSTENARATDNIFVKNRFIMKALISEIGNKKRLFFFKVGVNVESDFQEKNDKYHITWKEVLISLPAIVF